MFMNETLPMEFQNPTLHVILKSCNVRKEILSQNRFVHCKGWFARVAESLVVEDGLKQPLIEGSSMYQIGGQPGHRPEEMVYVMKSIIAKYMMDGKMII